jgi:hypothetical protein
MKKFLLSLIVAALGLSASATMAVIAQHSNDNAQNVDDAESVLKWKTMAAVQRPYVGPAQPVDGIPGGNAQWAIRRGWGHLNQNGELDIHVRGLVLPEPPFNGINTVPFFRGVVVCRSADAAGNPVTVQVFTGQFPASTAGDSDIQEIVALPTPCVAPTVFVVHPTALRWFATLGFN